MIGQTAIAVVAGAALMAIVWWPNSTGSPAALLLGNMALVQRRSFRSGPMVAAVVAALGFIAGQVLVGTTTGVAALALTAVGTWAIAVQIRSRRSLREADELAQLTNGLANQALVAPTVVEAVRQAAPLIPGRVGAAARLMAAECETGGLMEAAQPLCHHHPAADCRNAGHGVGRSVSGRLAVGGLGRGAGRRGPRRRPTPPAISTGTWPRSCPRSQSPW